MPGFDAGSQTLWCGNTALDQLVQVGPGPSLSQGPSLRSGSQPQIGASFQDRTGLVQAGPGPNQGLREGALLRRSTSAIG